MQIIVQSSHAIAEIHTAFTFALVYCMCVYCVLHKTKFLWEIIAIFPISVMIFDLTIWISIDKPNFTSLSRKHEWNFQLSKGVSVEEQYYVYSSKLRNFLFGKIWIFSSHQKSDRQPGLFFFQIRPVSNCKQSKQFQILSLLWIFINHGKLKRRQK